MKIKYFTIVIISVVSFSCSNSSQRMVYDFEKNLNKEYDYVIPDSLYSFFPKSNNSDVKLIELSHNAHNISPNDSLFEGILFLSKIYECNSDFISNLRTNWEKNALARILPNDTNYFIIWSPWLMKAKFEKSFLEVTYNKTDFINLLPDFSQIFDSYSVCYDSTTLCGLKPDYIIYVLKSDNRFVLDEGFKINRDIFPEKLKHGYKSGVAIEQKGKHVVFWAIAW